MLKSRALLELKIKRKKKETIKSLQLLTVLAHLNNTVKFNNREIKIKL